MGGGAVSNYMPGTTFLTGEDEEWIDCEYCSAEPGENGSFYCEECEGQGGHWREYDNSDDYF